MTKRERYEMEEREFTVSLTITKVYETEIKVKGDSDENVIAQVQEMLPEIAAGVGEDKVSEAIVDVEGVYDPVTVLDD